MSRNVSPFCISPETPIRRAIQDMDANAKGFLLVVDEQKHILGTITDGDVRRAILANVSLEEPVTVLLKRKKNSQYENPITALLGTSAGELLRLMQVNEIMHLPLLDTNAQVVDIAFLDDFLPGEKSSLQAVVMAGGFGKRLEHLTQDTPKPMLKVGETPILERIVRQLREAGIQQMHLTTHYKSEKISDYFGDGHDFGVQIQYVQEDQPLGTAGALRKIADSRHPLLVINGDILTDLDFKAMHRFHLEHQAHLTMAVCEHEIKVPYGVVEVSGAMVERIIEKPSKRFFVNAGIYLLDASVCAQIPPDISFHMTDLIGKLLEKKMNVVAFPLREYWLDIGKVEDYKRAVSDAKNGLI